MSVSAKLWGGFLTTILLGSVLIYQVSVIRGLAGANRRLATISSRVAVINTEQLYRLDQLEENAAKYMVTDDRRYAEQFVRFAETVQSTFDDMDTLALTPDEAARVDRIGRLDEGLATATQAFRNVAAGGEITVEDIEAMEVAERSIEELRNETLLLTEASRVAVVDEARRSTRDAQRAERRALVTAALVLLLGAMVTATVARSISRGLRHLSAGTRRVAEGEFEYRLSGSREREFRRLEGDFNVMVDRLAEAERMKKDFVAGISHDLKSPLASIRETLSVLLDEVPGPIVERQRRLLRLASQSGERLASRISNLLDLAQMEAHVLQYRFNATDLTTLVRGVVAEMEPRLREKDLEVELVLPAHATLHCDPGRMAQVVQNLVDNALKASPGGSAIEVEVREDREPPDPGRARSSTDGAAGEEGSLTLTVRDRGPGVPSPMRERIFERFVQGDGPSGSGVGLGLAICREIVTAHGGRLRVEDRPGGGSTFLVTLPRRARPVPADERARTRSSGSAAGTSA